MYLVYFAHACGFGAVVAIVIILMTFSFVSHLSAQVYSINRMQAQFLPLMFRPPASVCEDLLKKDNS